MKYHNQQLDHDKKNSCPVCRKDYVLNTIHKFSNRFYNCACGITSFRTLIERIPYVNETQINIVFAVTNEFFPHSDYKKIETAKLFYKYQDAYLYYTENIFEQWKKVIQTGIYPDHFSYIFQELEKINITVSKTMSDEEIKRFIHAIENFKIYHPYTCTFGHQLFTNAMNIHAIQDISETDSNNRTLIYEDINSSGFGFFNNLEKSGIPILALNQSQEVVDSILDKINHRELFRYALFTDDAERMLMSDFLKANFDDKWSIVSTGGKEKLQAFINSNKVKIESFNDIENIKKLKEQIEKISNFKFIDLYNYEKIEIE